MTLATQNPLCIHWYFWWLDSKVYNSRVRPKSQFLAPIHVRHSGKMFWIVIHAVAHQPFPPFAVFRMVMVGTKYKVQCWIAHFEIQMVLLSFVHGFTC